jgi:glycosyltransferase involved in cell wall biosynthesis
VKVLQLSSSYPRWDDDVSGIFIHDLAKALVAGGIETHVVAPHDAGAARREVLDGVHVHRFRYAPDRLEVLAHRGGLLAAARSAARIPLIPFFLVAYTWSAWREVRRVRPDVIHAHWWFPGGLAGAVASRLTGTPLAVTVHGSDLHLPMRRLGRAVLRRADVVGTVSDALQTSVRERFGVDAEVLRMPVAIVGAAPAAAPPADPPPLRLVAIGRNAPEKGFDVLVRALHGIDAQLDVFGAGTEVLTSDRVRGHGARSRDEIGRALTSAHALVVPSRNEGLGLAALEALAAGRPVIASAVGGLVETVEDGVDGILVPPDDVEALAGALRELPLPAPRARAVERHRPDEVTARHRLAYERAINARRR